MTRCPAYNIPKKCLEDAHELLNIIKALLPYGLEIVKIEWNSNIFSIYIQTESIKPVKHSLLFINIFNHLESLGWKYHNFDLNGNTYILQIWDKLASF